MQLRNFESRLFFALVLLTTFIFLWMTRTFLMPVFWAVVFAVLFQPLHLRICKRLNGREVLASLSTTAIVVFVVVIPFSWLGVTMTRQAMNLYKRISENQIDVTAPYSLFERKLPALTGFMNELGIDAGQIHTAVQSAAVKASQWIAGQTLAVGQNLITMTIMFFLMLYFLFFFFRDGNRLVETAIWALPLGDRREKRLFGKFADVARATVKGTLIVAAVQGAIGGILFWIVGIEGPVFWGTIMGVFSLIPAAGPTLVWVPAAIFLFATGEIWQAVVLVIGGAVFIGLIDNFLRPILVGRDTKIPDYFILIATLGGLHMFGLAGFVVGPIIAALFLVMWEMFANEQADAANSKG